MTHQGSWGAGGAGVRGLAIAAACAGCATTSADFRLSNIGADDAAIAGRLTIMYNGRIFNEHCTATFGGRPIKLSSDGIVLFHVPKGWTTMDRLNCLDTSNQHVRIKGAHFLARGDGWVTDFGDVAITWAAAGGFKASSLFGLVGALIDEASDDGVATVEVQPPVAEVRAAFRRQTGVDGKWTVEPLSQPAGGAGPPALRDPDAPEPGGPHFFCVSSGPGQRAVPACERDQASCDRMHRVAPGATCAPADTAWCYIDGARLACFATQDACHAQSQQATSALDECGEQY